MENREKPEEFIDDPDDYDYIGNMEETENLEVVQRPSTRDRKPKTFEDHNTYLCTAEENMEHFRDTLSVS